MFKQQRSTLAAAIGVTLAGALTIQTPVAHAEADKPAASSSLEEVVVTARKREETIEDVSATIAVIGGDLVRDGLMTDVRDMQYAVPGLTVGETVGAMKITMRALGNASNARGEDSQVAYHVDGAVVSRPEAQALSLFDVERIEILQGPQGTLYGRNATAGAINVVTNKPTEDTEGYLTVTAGNYSLMNIDAAVGGAISDNVLGRLAVTSMNHAGYGENITTNNQIDDQRRWGTRGQLEFKFADNVKWLVSGEYATERDATGLFTYLSPLYVVGNTTGAPGPKGAGGFSDPNSRDGAGNSDPIMDRDTMSLTSTLSWDINDNLSLKDIANYRYLHFYLSQDIDISSVATSPGATVSIPLHDEQWSNELQLLYSGEKLSLLGGLFYWSEQMNAVTKVGTMPNTNVWLKREGKSDGDSWAGFFNASYDLTKVFTARIGGRYTHDSRSIDSQQTLNGTINVPWNSPTNPANDSRSNSKYTGEYGVDVHFNDNTMAYFTYSQGYQQGAAIIMQTNNPIADPTDVSSYEVGFKFHTDDNRVILNLSAYDQDVKDLQRTRAVPLPGGSFATIVTNIDGMTAKGVQMDARWAPIDDLYLYAGASYTDAKFKDYLNDDPLQYGTLLVQLKDNTPGLTPDWKGNVGAQYTFHLGNGAELAAGADMSFTTKQYLDDFDRAPMIADAYNLYNAHLTYQPTNEHWSATLWGKNLSDEKEIFDASFSALGIVLSKRFVDPRTFGVTINLKL